MITENIRFRESNNGFVHVQIKTRDKWVTKFKDSEYRTSAEWAKDRFILDSADLMTLYQDYKDLYDEGIYVDRYGNDISA